MSNFSHQHDGKPDFALSKGKQRDIEKRILISLMYQIIKRWSAWKLAPVAPLVTFFDFFAHLKVT